MIARRFISTLNTALCGRTLSLEHNWLPQMTRAYGVDHEKIMHNWREKEANLHRSKVGDDPEKSKKFLWHPTAAPKKGYFSLGNISNWYASYITEFSQFSQRFIPERHEILGSDLATAHFIVARGGRVKFEDRDEWVEKDKKGSFNLPNKFDPEYVLEAVDVNGINLRYEGLSNLCGLIKLRWLSLKDCRNIDDWGLDKISAEYPQLEYLDISGCSITERGLESLYRMLSLKKLVATNHYNSAAFELTCFMLEDCIPGLSSDIRVPKKKPEE